MFITGYSCSLSVGVLPWSLVSVAVATKQQLCKHILLSWTLSIPGTRIRKAVLSHVSGLWSSFIPNALWLLKTLSTLCNHNLKYLNIGWMDLHKILDGHDTPRVKPVDFDDPGFSVVCLLPTTRHINEFNSWPAKEITFKIQDKCIYHYTAQAYIPQG